MDQKRKNTKHSLAMRLAALMLCGCLCGALYPAAALATEAAVSEATETPEPTATPESAAEPTPAPTETPTVVYSAEADGVTVKAEAAEGVLPADATLSVAVLDGDKKDAAAAELDNSGVQYDGFLALDLTFKDTEGTELEPNGAVSVSFALTDLPEDADAATLAVQHLEEDAAGEVTAVATVANTDTSDEETGTVTTDEAKVAEVVETINADTPEDVTVSADETAAVAEFTVDEFSTFTITYTYYSTTLSLSAIIYDVEKQTEINTKSGTTISKNLSNAYDYGEDFSDIFPSTIKDTDGNTYKYDHTQLDDAIVTSIKAVYKYNSGYTAEYYNGNTKKTGTTLKAYYKLSKLTPVETVDSASKGITVKMVDWHYQPFSGNEWYDKDAYNVSHPEGRGVKQGVLSSTLGDDDYPTLQSGNYINTSVASNFAGLFSGNDVQETNHLFIKSVYDDTGYYYFDSAKYGAFFDGKVVTEDNLKNFSVYQELITPAQNNSDSTYKVGAFLPYNSIAGMYEANNPTADGETLYYDPSKADYYFGMELSADFLQDENGYTNGNPMKYEFTGDDDLWVYIDGVLVLDLGGCHDARNGWIDFSTGEVYVQGNTNNATVTGLDMSIYEHTTDENGVDYYKTTLKNIFDKAKPGNNIEWKEVTLANGSTGYIFQDYSSHSMKVWYMERGQGSSNLMMKFNLPVIPAGQVQVKKELSNTDKELYADVEFQYQLYVQEIEKTDETTSVQTFKDDEYVLVTSEDMQGVTKAIKGEDADDESAQPLTISDNGIFTLKAGETATFTGLQNNRKYYVVELGVDPEKYSQVTLNGASLVSYTYETEEDASGNTVYKKDGDGNYIVKKSEQDFTGQKDDVTTSKETVSNRHMSLFTNNCSGLNSRELRITKAMADGKSSSDTFTFKVWLEGQSGNLVPYSGSYYLKDASGNYYYYNDQNALTSNGTTSKVCGTTTDGTVSDVGVGYAVVITQILADTSFAVQETGLNEKTYQAPQITVAEDTSETSSVQDAGKSVTALGKIKLGTDAEVTVTNSYIPTTGDLTITKTAKYNGSDLDVGNTKFTFTITKPTDVTVSGTYDVYDGTTKRSAGITFDATTDKASVTMTGAGTITIKDLPFGTYTVTETNSAGELVAVGTTTYEMKEPSYSSNGQATITKDASGTVTVTNTYEPAYRTLTVTKNVTGGMGVASDSFSFTVTSDKATIAYVSGVTATIDTNESSTTYNKKATFTLTGEADSNTITLKVPYGAKVTTTETNAETGYKASWEAQVGSETKQSGATQTTGELTVTDNTSVAFTNTRVPVTPTGITTDTTPYAVMILAGVVALGSGAVLTLRRKREG